MRSNNTTWIKYKDKTPKDQEVVDIFYCGKRETDYVYNKNYNTKGNNFFEAVNSGYTCVRDADYWMHRPKPPKETK